MAIPHRPVDVSQFSLSDMQKIVDYIEILIKIDRNIKIKEQQKEDRL